MSKSRRLKTSIGIILLVLVIAVTAIAIWFIRDSWVYSYTGTIVRIYEKENGCLVYAHCPDVTDELIALYIDYDTAQVDEDLLPILKQQQVGNRISVQAHRAQYILSCDTAHPVITIALVEQNAP